MRKIRAKLAVPTVQQEEERYDEQREADAFAKTIDAFPTEAIETPLCALEKEY